MAWFLFTLRLLTNIGTLGFGLVLPTFFTLNAIETANTDDDTQWLIYWLLYSLIELVESLAFPVLRVIPFYRQAKVGLMAWLTLPQTKGAVVVYHEVIAPAWRRVQQKMAKLPAVQERLKLQGEENLEWEELTEARVRSLSEKVDSVTHKKQAELKRALNDATGLKDPKARQQAIKTVTKSLAKIENMAAKPSSGLWGKKAS